MHEFGIAEAILHTIERRADGRPVRRARVRAGALLRVTGPSMRQAFTLVAQGSVAEGAELDLVIEPVRLTCRSCAHRTTSPDPFAVCPGCGGTDIDTEGGDGLVLESIHTTDIHTGADTCAGVHTTEAAHVPGHPGGDRPDPARPA